MVTDRDSSITLHTNTAVQFSKYIAHRTHLGHRGHQPGQRIYGALSRISNPSLSAEWILRIPVAVGPAVLPRPGINQEPQCPAQPPRRRIVYPTASFKNCSQAILLASRRYPTAKAVGTSALGRSHAFTCTLKVSDNSHLAAKPGQEILSSLDQYRYGTALDTFGSGSPDVVMGLDDVKRLVEWKLYVLLVCIYPASVA